MLPPQLPAATLSGSLSAATMASTLDDILRGRIKIVFVSPERLASPSFRRMFHGVWNADQAYRRRFPKVSLLCLDEAHCLSQWAHNFRPSYLRLCSAIQLIQPESILAITATAGPRVVEDISRVLFLNQDKSSQRDTSNGVLVLETDRDNIDVSTFILPSQEERLNAVRILHRAFSGNAACNTLAHCRLLSNFYDQLISLLLPQAKSQSKVSKSKVPQGCLSQGSVIVYVWRQRDAEIVAENIQASSVPGGVVVYHAGMKSCDREKAQNKVRNHRARSFRATFQGFSKAICPPVPSREGSDLRCDSCVRSWHRQV
jgi:superfamily II DNA helicase RecQ